MPDLNAFDWFANLSQVLGITELTAAPFGLLTHPTPAPTPLGLQPATPEKQIAAANASSKLVSPSGTPVATGATATGYTMSFPFPSSYFNPSDLTEKFGQSGPNNSTESGNDYQMPPGTPIYAPFDGSIGVEDQGKKNWGKRIFVTDPKTGAIFAVGHLHEFAVTTGTVHAGQIIGYSGGEASDPSSGNSTGPHVEVQLLKPVGDGNYQFVDPAAWLSSVFSGNTVAIPGLPGGAAVETQLPQGTYTTPDGHTIFPGTQEDRYYKMADAVWTKIYASHPPWSVVQSFIAQGIQNTDQLTNIINGMPSHIPGWSIGEYEGRKSVADNLAQKAWGRPVPDSLMSQLASQGIESPDQIQAWFANHPASAIPKEDYQQIFDLANAQVGPIWGTVPSPDQVATIHNQIINAIMPGQQIFPQAIVAGQPGPENPTSRG